MKSYTYDSDITKVEHIYGCKVTKKSRINRQNIRIFTKKVIYLRKNHFLSLKVCEIQKKAISLHLVIRMVTTQSPSIEILADADEEDCGVIIWWRRKPLPLNFKCNEIKRIKTFSLVFQGKTL